MKMEPQPACTHAQVSADRLTSPWSEESVERSARIFRALGEPARIRLVSHLARGPACVTELAQIEDQSVTVISQRLRVLRADNIVRRKREGRHILYSLADHHVLDLVTNCLAHASESVPRTAASNQDVSNQEP